VQNTAIGREWEASSTTTDGTSFHNRSFVIPPFSTFIPLSRDERDFRRSVKTRPTTPNVAFRRTSFLFHILEVSVQASDKRWGTRTDDFCQFRRSFRQMTIFTSHQVRPTSSSRAIRYLSVTLPCDVIYYELLIASLNKI